jgi:cytochrome oxidase Cu insertion factor (SCO1/SenC/PrrC family)
MKIFAASLVLAITGMALIGTLGAATTPDQNPPLPRKAPEFVFNMQDGKQLLLSSYRGKVVAVVFMFTTCPHCQALCPTLINIQKDYAAKGVQFVADVIDDGAKDGLAQFNQLYARGAFPVGWSKHESALEFLVHPNALFYVPMMAFVDRKGYIQSQYIGDNTAFFGDAEKSIRAELDKILAGTAGAKPAAAKSFTKTITSPTKK